MDIENKIKLDLKSGLTYLQIQKKYNLKSNYLIKKVKGLKNQNKYIRFNINIESIKNLNNNELSSIYAHFNNINKILKNKNIDKLIKLLCAELNGRDQTE